MKTNVKTDKLAKAERAAHLAKRIAERETAKAARATALVKAEQAKVKAPAARKPTVSSVAREMILAHKTNEEIWDVLTNRFGLDDDKRWYPGWYRADAVRKGLITKTEADKHRHAKQA